MEKRLKTDVLVIGAGIAGWQAADKARAGGADVIIADKGYIGKCGQSVYAGGFFVYNPEWGDKKEPIMEAVAKAGEYLNNRYWTETVLDGSYDVFCDLVSWGFDFEKDESGNYVRHPKMPGDLPEIAMNDSAKEPHKFSETFGYKARKHLKSIGVEILDRVMIVELLKEAGRVIGAVGMSVDKDEFYVIEAGAVILASGGCGLKSVGYPCYATSTGDGERMAMDVGCSIVGKEFVQPMRSSVENPAHLGCRGLKSGNGITEETGWPLVSPGAWKCAGEKRTPHEGKTGAYPLSYLDLELELHAGNAPITAQYKGKDIHVLTGGALGMSVRKADGIWPADKSCRSEAAGLYAAGDALGTMQNGALYLLRGGSMAGCAVTGAMAGKAAAEDVGKLKSENKDIRPSEDTVKEALDKVMAPLLRNNGYSPKWITQMLQNIMAPYFISYVKSEERLKGALSYAEFIEKHLAPNMVAFDQHELRLVHETRSMVQAVLVRLRSALFRTESRGMHFREDFPARDDENWLCWTKVSRADDGSGEMIFEKEAIPDEWKPDQDIPYEERYTYRFPGEMEARRNADGN